MGNSKLPFDPKLVCGLCRKQAKKVFELKSKKKTYMLCERCYNFNK